MRIEDLKKDSSSADVQAVIEWVAGMPEPDHAILVADVGARTGRG